MAGRKGKDGVAPKERAAKKGRAAKSKTATPDMARGAQAPPSPGDLDTTDPAVSLTVMQQSIAHSIALAMQNAVAYQQFLNTVNVALVAQLSGETGAAADGLRAAAEHISKLDPGKQIAEIKTIADTLLQQRSPRPS